MFPWGILSNPYWVSALAAAVAFVIYQLSHDSNLLNQKRDAKRRITAQHVTRVGPSSFLFHSGTRTSPDVLVNTVTGAVSTLHPKQTQQQTEPSELPDPPSCAEQMQQPQSNGQVPLTEQLQPDTAGGTRDIQPEQPVESQRSAMRSLSVTIPTTRVPPPFSMDLYEERPLASVPDIRILERGLHFEMGRALNIALGPSQEETTLHFKSRAATQAFIDALYHAAGNTSRPSNLSFFLTTFNVGNSQPPNDLSPWLGKANGVDVVAIGAQECSYTANSFASGSALRERTSWNSTQSEGSLMKENVINPATEASPLLEIETKNGAPGPLVRSSSSDLSRTSQTSASTSGKEHWQSLIASHFSEDEYVCITKQSAWDRCLTIFVKKHLLSAVSRVRHDTANVGLGGVAGNKGAIGTRFSVFDTDFVIINSHLAAHHKEVNRRNEDFTSIANGLHALRDANEVDILASKIHHMFWMGDLNYRINLTRDEVLDRISQQDWKRLQEADQLLQEMASGRAFQGFEEGETNFSPTYRYEYGSRKYSEVKLRIPSYCDRILYRSLPGCKLELKEYKPSDEILTSDHSPVYALFTASLVHTSGIRDVNKLTDLGGPNCREQGIMYSTLSPRALAVRSLISNGLPGFSESHGIQLIFKNLSAKDIPEMHRGGRRVAVAKALNIHGHLGLRKHDELGPGQHADPYCVFHGDAVAELDEGVYRTRTVTASQNPTWEASAIPFIDLIDTDLSILRRKYVIITVKDEDIPRRDDLIGSVVLWLGSGDVSATGTGEAVIDFSMPIMQGGRQQGELSGSYIIKNS